MKTFFIRTDGSGDNHNPAPLYHGEPVDVYNGNSDSNAMVTAVDELADRGGGFLHDVTGTAVKFVAPIADILRGGKR